MWTLHQSKDLLKFSWWAIPNYAKAQRNYTRLTHLSYYYASTYNFWGETLNCICLHITLFVWLNYDNRVASLGISIVDALDWSGIDRLTEEILQYIIKFTGSKFDVSSSLWSLGMKGGFSFFLRRDSQSNLSKKWWDFISAAPTFDPRRYWGSFYNRPSIKFLVLRKISYFKSYDKLSRYAGYRC